jgi:hypothetical protein
MKQCKACPWKKSTVPARDIPNNYCAEKHARLANTIAVPGAIRFSAVLRVMACHETSEGRERPCAGWLYHQLGEGNNIALRLAVHKGRYDAPDVDGPQHATFEATLGKKKKVKRP